MKLNKLKPEEEKIIIDKGTEKPYSGEYEQFDGKGIYVCRRCGAKLYRSEDKFDAHCGWPSFDDAVLGAVERTTDADGQRTEITCVRCGAHLGHVFTGEKFTPKDTRHCVNSLSMRFVPEKEIDSKRAFAYFGGGCFWCTEATFKLLQGVAAVVPGYAGGTKENPSYEEVSTGSTGHAEMIKIEYNPTIIAYEGLLEVFFTVHDPTTMNRQGNDAGTQYRSIIFCADELQKEIAEAFIKRLEADQVFDRPIVTEVKRLEKFFEAEEHHHDYFAKNPAMAYCRAVIAPKVLKLEKNFKNYLIK